MKFVKWIVLILSAVCFSGCVSPFYGTARIEEGLHVESGLSGTSFMTFNPERSGYYIGGRGDVAFRYGFSKNFQAYIRTGLGFGIDPINDTLIPATYRPSPTGFLFDAGLGLQGAIPFEYITPGLQLEIGANGMVSATALFGAGIKEWLTLGADLTWIPLYLFNAGTLHIPNGFITFHLSPKMSISTAIGIPNDEYPYSYPLLNFGIGYKIK